MKDIVKAFLYGMYRGYKGDWLSFQYTSFPKQRAYQTGVRFGIKI